MNNNIIPFLIFYPIFLFFPDLAIASCGEGKGQCYYYKAGQLVSQSQCEVRTCTGGGAVPYFFLNWNWNNGNTVIIRLSDDKNTVLVNNKPGFSLPLKFKDENLICYGIEGSDELLCNDSGVF